MKAPVVEAKKVEVAATNVEVAAAVVALVDVLQQRKIAGAGLDVTEMEPLSEESPLWELDNVILTPHAAGGSQHRPRRTVEFFCQNLKKYFNKKPMENLVDKRLGF